MDGCVGAIDGFFQQIQCPSRREIYNSNAYYSGHYESHGLNCQAMCDVNQSFLFFGVVAPGKTNDNGAYPKCYGVYNNNKKPFMITKSEDTSINKKNA